MGREIARHPSAEVFQMEAQIYLLRGGSKGPSAEDVPRTADPVDRAVQHFEEAHSRAPYHAGTLSDLSAAYFVRAQDSAEPYNYLQALDAADRAVAADKNLPEAWFNRALTLQALNLPMDALSTWDAYLKIEQDADWRREVEARRESLRTGTEPDSWDAQQPRLEEAALREDQEEVKQIVNRFRQATREHAEMSLLPAWGREWLAGRLDLAERSLRISRAIGIALAEVNGDRMTADSVAIIDAASEPRNPARLRLLAEGHRAFFEGYHLYRLQRGEEGAVRLAAARDALRRAGSPFVARAELYLAGCDYRRQRYGEALQAFEHLEGVWSGRPYPSFLGHLVWIQAATRSVRGEMAGSVRDYRSAVSIFEKLGEAENVAMLRGLLAEALDQLGLQKEAWKERFSALRESSHLRDLRYRTTVYVGMAEATLQQGYPAVALRFWNQVVRYAASSGDELMLGEVLSWRGLLRYRLGQLEEAQRDVLRARELVARHDDESARRKSLAIVSLIQGHLRIQRAPAEALRLLTDALQVYEETGHQPLALLAYRARAQAFRRAGDLKRAEEDLAAALKVHELFGRNVQDDEVRLAFLGATDEAFDEMISLQAVDLGEADRAFESADRARTRVLPSRISRVQTEAQERRRLLATEPEPLGLQEILRRVPRKTALIQYSVLPDRLLVWVVREKRARLYQKPVRQEDLKTRVAHLRIFHRLEWEQVSSDLQELLLQPWIREIEEGETLVFVPDKVLHAVPFAALRAQATGRYLVESYRIAISPSATLYVQALDREHRPSTIFIPRVLALGNPAFDHSVFELLALPAAEEEARGLAELYPRSTDLLLGKDATHGEFLSRVRQYDWVHFAGHAMVNEKNPLLSMLVLAPTAAGETGALYAREIYPMDLRGTRMVVLSACETGGFVPESEGASILARAFLAAGVPTVVASLWKVEDEPTAALFQAFYQELSRQGNTDPVSALRAAQLRILRSGEGATWGPTAWAAFEVIGASAN